MRGAFTKHLEDFSFEISAPQYVHRVVNVGNRQIHKKDDVLFFHLHIARNNGAPFTLKVFYLQKPVLQFRILSEPVHKKLQLGERLFYLCDTHQLEMTEDGYVKRIYLTLLNNKIAFDDSDMDPQIEPHLPFLFQGVGGVTQDSLDYLPLHPYDDDDIMEGVPLVMVPQRTPTWFATKNVPDIKFEVTSSNVGKFSAAYWLERDSNTEPQTIKEQLRKESLMRFGRIYEDCVMMTAMYNYPDWHYIESGRGYFSATELQRLGLFNPSWISYGSSRDGLAIIPGLTWDKYPHDYYRKIGIDPRRCALEFKASYMSTKFPDYYIPQLYWEMIEGEAAQAVLIRYKRRKANVNGNWTTKHEAMLYHIYRDPEVEAMIVRNVNMSVSRNQEVPLLTFVQENKASYDELAKKLKKIAEETEGVSLNIPQHLLDNYMKQRNMLIRNVSFNK